MVTSNCITKDCCSFIFIKNFFFWSSFLAGFASVVVGHWRGIWTIRNQFTLWLGWSVLPFPWFCLGSSPAGRFCWVCFLLGPDFVVWFHDFLCFQRQAHGFLYFADFGRFSLFWFSLFGVPSFLAPLFSPSCGQWPDQNQADPLPLCRFLLLFFDFLLGSSISPVTSAKPIFSTSLASAKEVRSSGKTPFCSRLKLLYFFFIQRMEDPHRHIVVSVVHNAFENICLYKRCIALLCFITLACRKMFQCIHVSIELIIEATL